jgi:hypothetical protein
VIQPSVGPGGKTHYFPAACGDQYPLMLDDTAEEGQVLVRSVEPGQPGETDLDRVSMQCRDGEGICEFCGTELRGPGRHRSSMPAPWFDGPDEGSPVAEQIRAEMVANVLAVLVGEGDAVEPGQAVVIMESMKMESPVLAESRGTVARISVGEGDVVQEGDVMVELG